MDPPGPKEWMEFGVCTEREDVVATDGLEIDDVAEPAVAFEGAKTARNERNEELADRDGLVGGNLHGAEEFDVELEDLLDLDLR